MTDPMTDADLDAIERDRLGKPRLGRSIARETDLDLLAIRRLLAEVRRLRAMETRVTMLAASWHYAWPGQRVDLSKSEQLRAALDGGER